MRVIIAGPRDLDLSVWGVEDIVTNSGFDVTGVVSGGASGVDRSGENYAYAYAKSVWRFPAEWEKHGKAAGPMRNAEMAEWADALIVIKRPGPMTKGTASMTREAKKHGLPIHVEEVS